MARSASKRDYCPCTTGGPIDFIGKKWTLCIVAVVGNYPGIRFNQLLESLSPISPRTLSETLKLLEQHGVLVRQYFRESPPRSEYSLTPDGRDLMQAIGPLMEWAARRPGAVCLPKLSLPPEQ